MSQVRCPVSDTLHVKILLLKGTSRCCQCHSYLHMRLEVRFEENHQRLIDNFLRTTAIKSIESFWLEKCLQNFSATIFHLVAYFSHIFLCLQSHSKECFPMQRKKSVAQLLQALFIISDSFAVISFLLHSDRNRQYYSFLIFKPTL